MPWKVRFREKDFIGNEGWDPEFEFEVREALTDTEELSGSAEIVIHVKGDSVDDVTVHESPIPTSSRSMASTVIILNLVRYFSSRAYPTKAKGK